LLTHGALFSRRPQPLLTHILPPYSLLDMGFQKEVNEIIRFLPAKQNRQTLLFSATVPQEVKAVMAATMKNDFVTVDCIHDQDPGSHTNKQVEQKHVILPYQTRLVTGTVEILSKLIANAKANKEPLKMVVFFNTANLVAYYAALFNEGLGIPVYELHSRKSQSFRTKTADKFRAAEAAILFTSDVSARGVDYPGVTNVVQVGIADSRESYIHRLGRTGRAGKVGEGLLVLADVERNFLNQLSGMDIPVHAEFQTALENAPDAVMMQKLQPIMNEIYKDDESPLAKNLQNAYRSMLGFYNGKLSKLGVKNPDTLIEFVNSFAMQGGCAQLPGIEKKTIGKMGLRTTTGLNITANLPRQGQGGGGRGGNRGGGGGGGGGRGSGGGRGAAPKRQMSTASTPEAKKPKAAGDRRRRGGGGGRGSRASAAN
jgi:ATP-dependent RNA helicase MSS116